MLIFQSWLDTLLIFSLLISNIVFIITLTREIKSLKSRNAELGNINKASLDLTENNSKSFELYRQSVNIDDLYSHFEWKVESATTQRVDEISKQLINEILSKENILKITSEYISEDLKKMHMSNFVFILYVIKSNNMGNDKINELVHTFFPYHLWIYNVILDKLPNFMPNKTTHTSISENKKDQF